MLRLISKCSLLETTDCHEKKRRKKCLVGHSLASHGFENHFVVQLFQNVLLQIPHTDYVTFECLII